MLAGNQISQDNNENLSSKQKMSKTTQRDQGRPPRHNKMGIPDYSQPSSNIPSDYKDKNMIYKTLDSVNNTALSKTHVLVEPQNASESKNSNAEDVSVSAVS